MTQPKEVLIDIEDVGAIKARCEGVAHAVAHGTRLGIAMFAEQLTKDIEKAHEQLTRDRANKGTDSKDAAPAPAEKPTNASASPESCSDSNQAGNRNRPRKPRK